MTETELQFEWDEAKAASNLLKHGVSFLTAAAIFDNDVLERIDDREDHGEVRLIGLGRVELEVYRVVYVWRADNLVRIISAQKAENMSGKSTIARHSLSAVRALRARGEDKTLAAAPEAESLGADFWKSARVACQPARRLFTCASTPTSSSGSRPAAKAT